MHCTHSTHSRHARTLVLITFSAPVPAGPPPASSVDSAACRVVSPPANAHLSTFPSAMSRNLLRSFSSSSFFNVSWRIFLRIQAARPPQPLHPQSSSCNFLPYLVAAEDIEPVNNSRNCFKRALRSTNLQTKSLLYLFKNKRALSSKRRCHPRFFRASAATSSSSVVVRLAQESFLKEYYRTGTNIVHSTNSFKKKQNNFHSNWTRCHLLRYKFWQRARAVGYVIHPNSTVTSRLCCHNPPCRAHR